MSTSTRSRARKPAAPDIQPTEPGKCYAELVRGEHYVLLRRQGGDLVFEVGQRREVSEAEFAHLATVIESVTTKDPEYGRCLRRYRKFALVGADGVMLDRLVAEDFIDTEAA